MMNIFEPNKCVLSTRKTIAPSVLVRLPICRDAHLHTPNLIVSMCAFYTNLCIFVSQKEFALVWIRSCHGLTIAALCLLHPRW